MIIARSSFSEITPFSKWFPSTLKQQAVVFKFLRFEERFRKDRFPDGLVWAVGLTREKKPRQIPPAYGREQQKKRSHCAL